MSDESVGLADHVDRTWNRAPFGGRPISVENGGLLMRIGRSLLTFAILFGAVSCSTEASPPPVAPVEQTSVSPAEAVPASARLLVSTEQYNCCHDDGSWGVLQVIDVESGAVSSLIAANDGGIETRFAPVDVGPGTYRLDFWQELCQAGCASAVDALDSVNSGEQRFDECSVEVSLEAERDLAVRAVWSPGAGCDSFAPE